MPRMRSASKNAQSSKRIGVAGIFRRFEAHGHVALCSEIVNFIGLNFLHETDEVRRIRKIAVVQAEPCRVFVRIGVEFVHAFGIE